MGLEDFQHIKIIGKGSYGEVWLARHKKDKKQYVLKKMNLGKASKRERKSAEQEAKLLSTLKHPNIVSYKDSFESDNGFLYIAMQYCEGGDLYARLKEQHSVPLEERQVVEWFVQIAMALQYMHERHILHRDLKTQNIFLTKNKIIKVGDLGIARVLDNASDMATTLIGTPYYMSPELFSNKPYNDKSDVWALGCCVYEMTTLKHAFNAKDMNSLVYKILKGKTPPMPRQYSEDLLSLMRSMLHQNPDKRPTVNRILRDPYIKRNIALFLEDTKKNARRSSSSQVSSTRSESRSSSLPTSSSSSSRRPTSSSSSNDVLKQSDTPIKKEVTSDNVFKERKSQDQDQKKSSSNLDFDDLVQSNNSSKSSVKPLPTPKVAISSGLPQHSESKMNAVLPSASKISSLQKESASQSGSLSSSKEECDSSSSPKESASHSQSLASSKDSISQSLDVDTPKSLINLSARQRRRQQKNDTVSSVEPPDSAHIKLRHPPHRAESERVTTAEKKLSVSEVKISASRHPSINDSTSSSSDDTLRSAPELPQEEKAQSKDSKEMNKFLTVLNTTLQKISVHHDSDEETPSAENHEEGRQSIRKSLSMPSVETLTNTSRLMNRIKTLHKDCIKGVGYTVLKKAYEILDKIDEDEVEPKLVDLLGKDNFDEYAGKIWQLKFCEESLYMS
ncbi:serine/threonine-protein kinase Nek4 [Biomphalaria glabrata]|nr:serine/threonine-protein kinase Nek4-like [Biomphalaria glabrata]